MIVLLEVLTEELLRESWQVHLQNVSLAAESHYASALEELGVWEHGWCISELAYMLQGLGM